MQRHFPINGINFEAGHCSWQGFAEEPISFFDPECLAFIEAFSTCLLKEANELPNLAALGFFLRPSQLKALRNNYAGSYRPRGLSFHISPSNVASTAVFSWLCSLLAGNFSIVRLSSSLNQEQQRLMSILGELFEQKKHQKISQATRFIRYQRSDEINSELSKIADVRVLWGGDKTIQQFTHYSTPAHTAELRFCDRYSVAVIDGDYLLSLDQAKLVEYAEKLTNDIISFSQKACSSPSFIYWFGSLNMQQHFFESLGKAVKSIVNKEHYSANEQLVSSQYIAMANNLQKSLKCNELYFHWASLNEQLHHQSAQNGNVFVKEYPAIGAYSPSIGLIAQTCVVLTSAEKLPVIQSKIAADRYVKPGQALSLDWVWDGMDIIALNSRRVMM